GNPYPSPINWQNESKTNLSPFYYSFDVVSGSYVAGLGDTLIASGQAFFVQATGANPTITFTENSKSTSAPRNYFKSSNSKMNVRMVKDAFNSDLLSIVFAQGADSNFQAMEDAIKMTNSVVNFSSMVNNDSLRLQYNTRPLLTSNTDTIKLYADAANGTYSFNFDGIQTVNNAYSVILLDAFTNSTVNLRLVSNYTFSITSSAASKGASRFKIIFTEVGALPVQLASFEGQKVGVDAKLKWTTASENNSNYFVVERSFDKKLWQELGLVNAKGNSSVLNVYGFTDVNAFETPALCYYRLKQVDKNNASTYSQIIVLDTKAASTEIVVYPTPTRNLLNIKTNTENANVLIELSDAMGKLVLQKSLVKNGNEVQLDMSDLRVGVYLLKYTEDGVVTIKKVIKQ
ncbi:MAG: T9SS type A sorting domain-containing protein, partial [Bacteroidia bacterium]|nr:T9SS type A sorting domain-containing protein [Bacteroidia bacterium]